MFLICLIFNNTLLVALVMKYISRIILLKCIHFYIVYEILIYSNIIKIFITKQIKFLFDLNKNITICFIFVYFSLHLLRNVINQ